MLKSPIDKTSLSTYILVSPCLHLCSHRKPFLWVPSLFLTVVRCSYLVFLCRYPDLLTCLYQHLYHVSITSLHLYHVPIVSLTPSLIYLTISTSIPYHILTLFNTALDVYTLFYISYIFIHVLWHVWHVLHVYWHVSWNLNEDFIIWYLPNYNFFCNFFSF
jgi:hypothetical protein